MNVTERQEMLDYIPTLLQELAEKGSWAYPECYEARMRKYESDAYVIITKAAAIRTNIATITEAGRSAAESGN